MGFRFRTPKVIGRFSYEIQMETYIGFWFDHKAVGKDVYRFSIVFDRHWLPYDNSGNDTNASAEIFFGNPRFSALSKIVKWQRIFQRSASVNKNYLKSYCFKSSFFNIFDKGKTVFYIIIYCKTFALFQQYGINATFKKRTIWKKNDNYFKQY